MPNQTTTLSPVLFTVWRTCMACTAVLFVMATALAQTNGVDFPDRVTTRLVDLEFCADNGRFDSEIESLLAKALSQHFIVLQRGGIQDAIEREQLDNMGGLFDENQRAELGVLEGAGAIVSASLNCREQRQVLTVNITSVETTRLLYTHSFYGVDLKHAFRLFEVDLDRLMNKDEHPLREMTQEQLRDNVFDLHVVDYQFADFWTNAVEQVLFTGLKEYTSSPTLDVHGLVKVNMVSDHLGMMTSQVELQPSKFRQLTKHLQAHVNMVPERTAPTYDENIVRVESHPSWPFHLTLNERKSVNWNGSSPVGTESWKSQLQSAPQGRYVFRLHSLRLGMREYSSNQLLEGKGRKEISSMAFSAIIPGSGIGFGTFGNNKGRHHLLIVGSLACASLGTRLNARKHYNNYQNASNQQEATATYTAANTWHKASLILSGCTLVSWSWNLADTYQKVRAHNKRIHSFMSNQ